MSYETHVYAMLGIHCKDVVTTTNSRERGCNHPESASGLPEIAAKYCAVCGKAIWVKIKINDRLSDKLEHLQDWRGDIDTGEFCYEKLSMIYSPATGPTDFMVGRVLGEFDTCYEGIAKEFQVLRIDEYDAVKAETKALLEPLGLWDENKFGWRLYSIAV